MKIKTTFIFLFASIIMLTYQGQVKGQTNTTATTTNWSTNPFNHKLFIENKGQFDAYARKDDKILYGALLGKVFAFITNHGLVYEYTEYPERTSEPDEEKDKIDTSDKPILHYLDVAWQGSDNNGNIVADEIQSNYTTYFDKNGGIKASLFKKITCYNIYPGIDVEYSFSKNKDGLEYSFIVHPGADASVIKVKYDGDLTMAISPKGNIDIQTRWGSFTDYAPVVYYAQSTDTIHSAYILNNNIESFSIGNTDHSKTLVIDPYVVNWTQNPAILSNDAFDVDYDYNGNVYACGTGNMEVVKMNSAGTVLWSFNGNSIFSQPGFYGGFCVDKIHGSVYIANGIPKQSPLGPAVIKLNNAGVYVTGINNTTLMYEYWRARYDQCSNQVIIAGGGATGHNDVLRIDSNLATPTYLNPFFPTSTLYQDLCGIAIDPSDTYCYMASSTGDESTHNNHIIQMPMPNLAVTNWNVADNFTFNELGITYTAGLLNNAMNCLTASLHFLYMYDGKNLKEYNIATGAQLLTATMPGSSSYADGGIDVDLCDNVYIGNLKTVYVYNSALAQTATIGPLTNTIFDVKLGQNQFYGYDSILYVCGGNFVSSIKLNLPAPGPKITKTHTTGCGCTSTATATLNFCGAPYAGALTYNWSNGQTTQTATGLCLGTTYTVTIKFGCTNQFVDTVKVPATCGVLPISLLDFNCTLVSGGIKLNWSTATETNNKYFIIERSTDGVNFQTIATVQGAGNSSSTLNYAYTDETPFNGLNYYRLSQTDFDGKSASYNITSCNVNNELIGNVYPNPSTGKFSVSIDNSVSEIQVYNTIGQKIYDKSLLQNSGNTIDLDLSSVASGVYILNVIRPNLNKTIVKKIIVYPR